ncbi:hypothetical protein E8E13_000926 [Curvularia kusanoi]|uniref:Cytochrome P450 n=1 Tax=Curvularia kusanoi TaxID=90978 RepID=A0A9P4W259_CURKU|nr:hypothetical protein E8E13_000926 [Curvularia kusanoi]
MDLELLGIVVLGVACVLYAYYGLGLDTIIAPPSIADIFKEASTTIDDFRNARYYKPWKRSKPIIVSSKKQIAELSEAAVLSQRAVYADMFGFKYTLNKFDHNEIAQVKSRLLGRLLQVQGVNHLPKMFPYLSKRANQSLLEQVANGRSLANGNISLPVASTVRSVASKIMEVLFFGEKMPSDPMFASALLQYPKEMVTCMSIFQITPSFLSSFVHNIITKRGRAQKTILKRLARVMGPRRETWEESSPLKEMTFAWNISSLTSESSYWQGPDHCAQTLLGVWFAAAHQPWMNLDFIMLQLCQRPEWQDAIQKEAGPIGDLTYETLTKLPLLDSFIKETVRLHPLDTLAVRRKALQPYTFASGTPHVPEGATVAVSSYDQMHDSSYYVTPNEFQPQRFIQDESPAAASKFTEVSEKFPVWGYGSLAW